jgi:hypothetical protein
MKNLAQGNGNEIRVTTRVSENIALALANLATAEGRTVSNLMRLILARAVTVKPPLVSK